MSAYSDLIEYLEGEKVEAIIIGEYWGGVEDNMHVPSDLIGKKLNLDDLKWHMGSWSFNRGLGSRECFPAHVWTESRVIFVTCYDGGSWLSHVPRNPSNAMPQFHGG